MASTFIGMKIEKTIKEETKKTELTVSELKAELDELGIKYEKNAKKDDLLALLNKEG